ncbi:MAG: hypothetical protein D6729_19665, partial [Deltaproteobacteria bacterium]
PVIVSFAGNPTSLDTMNGPTSSDLTWETTDASEIQLWDLDAMGLPANMIYSSTDAAVVAMGSYTVSPTATTTYRLLALNPAGAQVEADVTIIVDGAAVTAFTASPADILMGQTTTLTWTTDRADTVRIDPQPVEMIVGGFVDISTTGTPLMPGPTPTDAVTLTFPTGFAFPFDGTDRAEVQVANAGYLNFDTTASVSASNDPIPSTGTPNGGLIAPFWDYLQPSMTGEIFYELKTDPMRGDYLVIQWSHYEFNFSSRNPADLNFQVWLWANGDVDFHYATMTSAPDSFSGCDYAEGSSATIGWENVAGDAGTEILNNSCSGGLSGLGLRFHFALPTSGSVNATLFNTTTYTLTASNANGTDTATTTVNVWPDLSQNNWTFTASSTAVQEGEIITFTWDVPGGTSAQLYETAPGGMPTPVSGCSSTGTTNTSGTCDVTAGTAGQYTYELRVSNPLSTGSQTITVDVFPVLAIQSLTASPEFVYGPGNQRTQICWTGTGGDSAELRKDGIPIDISMLNPNNDCYTDNAVSATSNYVFILIDTVNGRQVSATVTVYYNAASVDSLTASQTQILPGGTSTISWSTSNATSVTVTPPPPSVQEISPGFQSIVGQAGTTRLSLSSNDYGKALVTFPSGFTFPYYGTDRTKIQVHADGLVSFGMDGSGFGNDPIPSTSAPNGGVIAPFWDDLDASDPLDPMNMASNVYWRHEFGTGGNPDRLIVEWNDVRKWGTSCSLNFQLVLLSTGAFEMHYGTMSCPTQADADGASASIGYENDDGTLGYALTYNSAVPGGLSNRSWLYNPVIPASGSFDATPSETTTYEVCATGNGYTDCKTVTVVVVHPGDVLVSEFMANPIGVPDADGEWVELTNVTGYDIDLGGFVLADADPMNPDTYTITGPLTIPAGGTVVLGRNADSAVNDGVPVDQAYGTAFALANSADEILLSWQGTEIDRVEYDTAAGWTIDPGVANSVDPNLLRPGDPTVNDSGWCQAVTPYGTQGNLGTPNAANDVSCRILSATVTPGLAIPDDSGSATTCGAVGAVSATLTLPPPLDPMATIGDVDVGVTISHTWNSDLDIFLEYDDGSGNPVCVELSTDNGSSGDGYIGVVFDDEAMATIAGAPTGVLSGRYQPEAPLNVLDGLPTTGTWTLWVSDDAFGDTGTLDEFSVTVTMQ